MKTALLIVSFGTMQEAAWENSIQAVERELTSAFAKECKVVTAYTSPRVLAYWKERGRMLQTPEEALERLAQEGVRCVWVFSTLLENGAEYAKLRSCMAARQKKFETLHLSAPLLEGKERLMRLAQMVQQELQPEQDEVLVLMRHGTKRGEAAQGCDVVCAAERLRGGLLVASMEAGPEAVMRQLRLWGTKRVLLAPLMLTAGRHALRDMQGESGWEGQLAKAGFRVRAVARGLGEMPAVRTLLVQMVKEKLG